MARPRLHVQNCSCQDACVDIGCANPDHDFYYDDPRCVALSKREGGKP